MTNDSSQLAVLADPTAGYSFATRQEAISLRESSPVSCWMWRVKSVTLAIRKPGYFDTHTKSNSAALNCPLICERAFVKALRIADLSVRPKPRREAEPCS